jgi:hypothetical protein
VAIDSTKLSSQTNVTKEAEKPLRWDLLRAYRGVHHSCHPFPFHATKALHMYSCLGCSFVKAADTVKSC